MQYRHISTHAHTHIYNVSRTGTRKERPWERGSIRWLQSGSTEVRSVGALCIWQIECQELNVDAGILGCHGEGCEMIMVHAS